MQAGGSHLVRRWRPFSKSLVLSLVAACWAAAPSAAHAAATVPGVSAPAAVLETAHSAVPPVQNAGEDLARVVEPVVSGAVTPAPPAGESPVDHTVAPIAGAAGATLPPAAAAVPQAHIDEHARASIARVAASASAERLSARPRVHRQSSHGVARQRPSDERAASPQGAARHGTSAATAPDAAATPSRSTPDSGFGLQDGSAAAGASTGFLFGGALALLVATLLLAGPRLRRQLPVPPAVCRPAAFLVVLERPG